MQSKEEDKAHPGSVSDVQSALTVLKESQMASKINYILTQNGISTTSPTLRLDIESASDKLVLELEAKDLEKLFSRFGTVESVTVPPNQKSTATIVFCDPIAAYLAQQTLNQHYIPAYEARIFVKWNSEESAGSISSAGDVPLMQRKCEIPHLGRYE